MRGRARFLASALATLALACGGSLIGPRAGRIPLGPWGGEHVGLEVGIDATQLEFDCAHGRIDGPIRVDGEGRFSQSGVFVRERGGPVGDLPPDVHPAVYFGVSDGLVLTFSLTLRDDGQTLEPFTAIYRQTPRLLRCYLAGPQ